MRPWNRPMRRWTRQWRHSKPKWPAASRRKPRCAPPGTPRKRPTLPRLMPVGVMLGQSQLLRIEGGLSTQQDGRVGAIARAAQHMMELADGVLEFASIGNGRTALQPNSVAV